MATDRAASASPYSPQLDGLRAAAVVAVAYAHWLPGWQAGVPLGAGVHLFFVLSGFLITRILLSLRDTTARGHALRRFYLRRALRLFPTFYVVLAAAWVADVPLVRETWAWHATYLSNLYIASAERWLGHVSHFWSLAVEEQFYLVWPWLIVWSPRAWLGPALGAAVTAGPVSRLAAAGLGLDEPFWALVPAGSADSLGLGALVAWTAWRRDATRAATPAWPGPRLTAAAAAGWCGLAVLDAVSHPAPAAFAVWRQLLQGLVFAWIVSRAVEGFAGPVGRMLSHRATLFVGRISYGIYLVHAFAPLVLDAMLRAAHLQAFVPSRPLARAAASLTTAVVLATALWYVVERPFHRLKARI